MSLKLKNELLQLGFSDNQISNALKQFPNGIDVNIAINWIMDGAHITTTLPNNNNNNSNNNNNYSNNNNNNNYSNNNNNRIYNPYNNYNNNVNNNHQLNPNLNYYNNLNQSNYNPNMNNMTNNNRLMTTAANNSSNNNNKEEEEISKAIEESLKVAKFDPSLAEPDNPNRQLKHDNIPVGLKNIGNMCYFNSLLQVYYRLRPDFHYHIISLNTDILINNLQPNTKQQKAVLFFREWQKLLISLQCSKRRYVDPEKCVKRLFEYSETDEEMAAQQDVVEWSTIIIQAIEDTFNYASHIIPNNTNIKTFMDYMKIMFECDLKQILLSDNNNNKSDDNKIEEKEIGEAITTVEPVTDNNQLSSTSKIERQIILPISSGDLYAAMNEYTFEEGIQYKREDGEKILAEQESWFNSFPAIFAVQLRRVKYDVEKQSAIKIHSRFDFPINFYSDRYLLKNQSMNRKKRALLKVLYDKKNTIENELKAFQEYKLNNSNINISLNNSFHAVCKYIEESNNKNEVVLSYIKKLSENIDENEHELKTKLNEINHNIDHLYDDMKNEKYTLIAALVHDGELAGQGHFWAYVREHRDINNNCNEWYKYNDALVEKVNEDEVMSVCKGSGHSSAYFLIYAYDNNNSGSHMPKLHQLDYNEDDMKNYEQQCLESFPMQLYNEILLDNQTLMKSIEVYESKKLSSSINNIAKQVVNDVYQDIQTLLKSKLNMIEQYPFSPDLRLKNFKSHLYVLLRTNPTDNRLIKYVILSERLKKVKTTKTYENKVKLIIQPLQHQFLVKEDYDLAPILNYHENKSNNNNNNKNKNNEHDEIIANELDITNQDRQRILNYWFEYLECIKITKELLCVFKYINNNELWCAVILLEKLLKSNAKLYTAKSSRVNEIKFYLQICYEILFHQILDKVKNNKANDNDLDEAVYISKHIALLFHGDSIVNDFFLEPWILQQENHENNVKMIQVTMALSDEDSFSNDNITIPAHLKSLIIDTTTFINDNTVTLYEAHHSTSSLALKKLGQLLKSLNILHPLLH